MRVRLRRGATARGTELWGYGRDRAVLGRSARARVVGFWRRRQRPGCVVRGSSRRPSAWRRGSPAARFAGISSHGWAPASRRGTRRRHAPPLVSRESAGAEPRCARSPSTCRARAARPPRARARTPARPCREPQPQPLSQTRRRAWSPPVHHLAGDMQMISHAASDVEPCGCSLASLLYFQR